MAALDLTGQRFGRLVAVRRAPNHTQPSGRTYTAWEVVCDCGGRKAVMTINLRAGITASCGCYQTEVRVAQGLRNRRAVASYNTMHHRLRRRRGPARSHACTDCGGPAVSWSYDHTDPDELSEEYVTKAGSHLVLHYSLDESRYAPRCVSCHALLDAASKRARMESAA